jgi:hypothetical protein
VLCLPPTLPFGVGDGFQYDLVHPEIDLWLSNLDVMRSTCDFHVAYRCQIQKLGSNEYLGKPLPKNEYGSSSGGLGVSVHSSFLHPPFHSAFGTNK